MHIQTLATRVRIGVAILVAIGWASVARAQWTDAGAGPRPNASQCLLLTDGRVLCQAADGGQDWQTLTPDINGSYVTGTWTPVASLSSLPAPNNDYGPRFFASAVLADGRVIVSGGEYCLGACADATNKGAIYDPVANTWTFVPFPLANVSDSDSFVLPDGRFVIRHYTSTRLFQFNPGTNNFTEITSNGKADNHSEENAALLPNGTVLTVDNGTQGGTGSEIYDPATGNWTTAGSTQVSTVDNTPIPGFVPESGPLVLRPDGTVVQFGGSANNAIYSTATGNWTAGPTFPMNGGVQQVMADAPAALLPNGNILVVTSQFFSGPYHTYEFTAAPGNAFVPTASDPPGNGGDPSYQTRTLVLPTGQVLLTNGSGTPQLYTAGGTFQDAWRPVITNAPKSVSPSSTYTLSGRQFNGLSQASMYGDDAQMATNYPLVRITNHATGHVFYARTYGHSSMGVATGNQVVSTFFDTPSNLESGPSDLVVVANGIPSLNWVINGPGLTIPGPITTEACVGDTSTATLNICNTGKADLNINNITSSVSQVTVDNPGYTVVISPDFCFPFQVHYTPTVPGTTNATLTIASNDPNKPSADVSVTGASEAPTIVANLVNSGVFANTCPGALSDAPILYVTNSSQCPLVISSLSSNNANFLTPTTNPPLPMTVPPHDTVAMPVRFKPTGLSCSDSVARTGTITINSNDPAHASLAQDVSGFVPCPDINATIANTGSFGNVCEGDQSDLSLQILNQGQCNLNITSLTLTGPGGASFILPSVSFPLVLSHDANVNLPIRFSPTGVCSDSVPRTATVNVFSNDPDTSPLSKPVSGLEACPHIVLSPPNLTGIYAFPATVSDPTGNLGCYTDRNISISNSGLCPLKILSLTAAPSDTFNVINPTFPLVVGPGGGPVPVTVRFRPTNLTGQLNNAPDEQTGTLSIVSNDPATSTPIANLCGEPTTRSGIRVLVTDGAIAPVSPLKSLTLQSSGLSPQFKQSLSNIVPASASICGNPPVIYHLDNETLPPAGTTGANPKSSYTLTAQNNGKPISTSFTLGQCEMKIFTLQYK